LLASHWGLFDLAPHHWRQPIENMFAVQDPKLWSPNPALRMRLFKIRRFGGVEAMRSGTNACDSSRSTH